ASLSSKPFGDGGVHNGSPSRPCPSANGSGSPRVPVARIIATAHSHGRLSFVCSGAQASSAVIRPLALSLRLPAGSRKICSSRSTSWGGGSSATKWRELAGNVAGDGRMAGDISQHGAALFDAGIDIGLVHDALRPRLVHAPVEDELGAVR